MEQRLAGLEGGCKRGAVYGRTDAAILWSVGLQVIGLRGLVDIPCDKRAIGGNVAFSDFVATDPTMVTADGPTNIPSIVLASGRVKAIVKPDGKMILTSEL